MSGSISQFRALVHEMLCSKYFVHVCVISAFILRMCWISLMTPEPISDFGVYYNSAVALSEGRGYITIEGTPSAKWPVGYPGFLALLFRMFGPSVFVGKMANVILYMGILFLSYYLSRKLFSSELTGRMTLAILSFYPNHIVYCSLLGSEILSTFMFLLAASLLISAGSKVLMGLPSGLLFGLGCLVRPETLLAPVTLFAEGLAKRIREGKFRKHLALFLVTYASLALTILPWEVRNYNIFGRFVFVSTNGGTQLLMGNNPYAVGRYFWNRELQGMLGDAGNAAERDARARTLALDYMRHHPLRVISLWPSKFYHLYYRDTGGVDWNERGIGSTHGRDIMLFRGLKILSQTYYMLIMIAFFVAFLFLLGSKRYKARFPQSSIVAMWVIAYFTAVALVYYGNERYHFRTVPWIVMYVGALATLYVAPHRENESANLLSP